MHNGTENDQINNNNMHITKMEAIATQQQARHAVTNKTKIWIHPTIQYSVV